MKKIIFSVFVLILLVGTGFIFNTSASATTTSSPLDSPESYINYLENYSTQEALKSGVSSETLATKVATTGSKEEAEKFKKLPRAKQEKFLEVLRDPELQKAIYKGDFKKLPASIRKDFYWTEEVTETAPTFGILASKRTITHTGKLSAFGLSLTGYKITGVYEYNSTGATKALDVDPEVEYNYNPSVETGLSSYGMYISNNEYVGRGTFYYKIGIQGVGGIQIGNVYIQVEGDEDGKTSGSFWRS